MFCTFSFVQLTKAYEAKMPAIKFLLINVIETHCYVRDGHGIGFYWANESSIRTNCNWTFQP